jgi:hypothetical protein
MIPAEQYRKYEKMIQELKDELSLNKSLLAKQCDAARDAETNSMRLKRELADAREQIDILLKVAGNCIWKEDDEGIWETTCGEAFTIIEGTPGGNDMEYCCYCGKPLEEVKFEGDTE